MLTFGSLFAGIGGFDLGFERAGFQCKWQVEIDDYATKILERHWPNVHRERDIRQCGRHNLERVDCIIGGFPCQDISYAGKGAGLDGARSGLFFEAIRLVRELQPRAVVLENVAGLLTRGLDRVLGTLAEIGFDAEWHCIPAAAVGAPHYRDRVFVLAFNANGFDVSSLGASAKFQQETAASRSSGGEDSKSCTDSNSRRQQERSEQDSSAKGWQQPSQRNYACGLCKDVPDTMRERGQAGFSKQKQRQEGHAGKPFDSGARWPCGSSWWQSEPAVGELADGVSGGLVRFAGRVATGIPNRVHKLRCLGNAIVPQVAEVVARMTMDRLTRGV